MLSRTSSIAFRTSSRIVAYWARRSTSGISCVATALMRWKLLSRADPLARGQVAQPRVRVRVDADEAGEVADVVLELHRWVAGPHRPRRHRVTDDAPGADERVLADLDPRQDRAVRADARAAPDDAAFDAVEIGGALGVGVVREHDVRAEKDVVFDVGQLQKAAGVDANARPDAVAELERRMGADRGGGASRVVLAGRPVLT